MLGTDDNQEPRWRRAPLTLTAEGIALEHDPAYLVQIRARKAMLQAQASDLEVTGAAD